MRPPRRRGLRDHRRTGEVHLHGKGDEVRSVPLARRARELVSAWLDVRGRQPARPVSRISALGTKPVSPDYLDKHQLRGISLEHIRRDRILQKALATGADPLHLALVFNIDHTTTMAYANAASNLLSSPANRHRHATRSKHESTPGTRADADGGRYG